jgi:hypothetical protein
MSSQARIRFLEGQLNTLKESAQVAGTNINRMWDFRQGADLLTAEERDALEKYLMGKVAMLELHTIGSSVKY